MVRCLFQNYYVSYGSKKPKIDSIYMSVIQKSTRFLFRGSKIDPIFIEQKLTRFLLNKNRPDFYYITISVRDSLNFRTVRFKIP